MRRLIAIICLLLPLVAFSKGPKTGMESFRYELYSEGGCTVYYIHKTADGTSFYYREAGSLEGWRLSSIDGDAINGFAKIWKKHKLASLEEAELDSEDKSRDRCVIVAGFGSEAGHSIIQYLDSPRSENELKLESAVRECVRELLEKQESSSRKCVKSKCIYSPDGQFLKRLDYDEEGKLCGGYDALDPFARF